LETEVKGGIGSHIEFVAFFQVETAIVQELLWSARTGTEKNWLLFFLVLILVKSKSKGRG